MRAGWPVSVDKKGNPFRYLVGPRMQEKNPKNISEPARQFPDKLNVYVTAGKSDPTIPSGYATTRSGPYYQALEKAFGTQWTVLRDFVMPRGTRILLPETGARPMP
jgi:hypothetical protein